MDSRSCEECASLRRELNEAIAAERVRASATGQDLARWIEELDAEECARIRERSAVWRAWRKLADHRVRTGHAVSLLPSMGASWN